MNSQLVSAIITTHNRKELLESAIESVKSQTYDNIECIVIDDASIDGTQSYCLERNDITYIRIDSHESKGGNYARNLGVKNSKGNYIAFLDDDDEWTPSKIEKQMELILSNEMIGFVSCGRIAYETKKDNVLYKVVPDPIFKKSASTEIFFSTPFLTSTILIRKDILKQAGFFDEELKYWQEYELTIRLCQVTTPDYVNEHLVFYRVANNDNLRLTNHYYPWKKSISYIENKHSQLISNLTLKQKLKRILLINKDGFFRAKRARQFGYVFYHGAIVFVIKLLAKVNNFHKQIKAK